MRPSHFYTGTKVMPSQGKFAGHTGHIMHIAGNYYFYIHSYLYVYDQERDIMQSLFPYIPTDVFPAACFHQSTNYELFPEN